MGNDHHDPPLTALIKRPSGLLERRELPALTMDDAIERGWRTGDSGLMLPAEPDRVYLQTQPRPGWMYVLPISPAGEPGWLSVPPV